MQLRHLPRHKSGTKYHAPNPGRPVPMADVGVRHDVKHRYFPENVDRIPQCKVYELHFFIEHNYINFFIYITLIVLSNIMIFFCSILTQHNSIQILLQWWSLVISITFTELSPPPHVRGLFK